MGLSMAQELMQYPEEVRKGIIESLPIDVQADLAYDWKIWGRPDQFAPEGDWRVWLIQAGRGWGKTRTAGEWVRGQVESGRCTRLALIGATAADARDVMVEGESGLLNICPPRNKPIYEPSKRRLTWPNGSIATLYTADEPERLRGPQHDGLWADEPASWRRPDAWDMAMFGLRLGTDPRAVVSGTPKPVPLIRALRALPTTVITRGRTLDNAANLAKPFLDTIITKYQGTRLGRQELDGELLEDTPGALWDWGMFNEEGFRVTEDDLPLMKRVVVGVDPAASSNENSDETGIIAAGLGMDGRFYVLGDYSLRAGPTEWATAAIRLFKRLRADRIIAERNNGGEMVEAVLRTVDKNAAITTVWASRGKLTRAEPIAALYEQNRVHHLGDMLDLETQLTEWVPGEGDSPDRLDALVWALTELSGGSEPVSGVVITGGEGRVDM